jgi:hypothetical protein
MVVVEATLEVVKATPIGGDDWRNTCTSHSSSHDWCMSLLDVNFKFTTTASVIFPSQQTTIRRVLK